MTQNMSWKVRLVPSSMHSAHETVHWDCEATCTVTHLHCSDQWAVTRPMRSSNTMLPVRNIGQGRGTVLNAKRSSLSFFNSEHARVVGKGWGALLDKVLTRVCLWPMPCQNNHLLTKFRFQKVWKKMFVLIC
jgi:hypothetical protein